MMWRWLTFFSALALSAAQAATVGGIVELAGDAKRAQSRAGVVVWLEPVGETAAPIRPGTAQMVQEKKLFRPHVLAIPVGTAVEFPNFDPIFHNAFSNVDGQPFDVGLYPPGTTRRVVFRRPGIVRVFCNIHAAMSAVIVVLKTPYLAVSEAGGEFAMRDVPPGEYTLHVFSERATEETLKALSRRVTVGEEHLRLPPLAVSESGYLQVPHKNKYGRDYPPVPNGTPAYSGNRP